MPPPWPNRRPVFAVRQGKGAGPVLQRRAVLFEVEKRLKKLGVPIGCLIGVDLAGQAVAAARANGQKAHSAAMIVHKDILRFSARGTV